ncbi:MAG: polysaccharide deacetylase family protein [Mangrovicoccus sp.]
MADILMYHGIDDSGGATSIPAPVFQMQMATLTESGRPVLSLSEYLATRRDDAVVITFDDALVNFAEIAWPILQKHRFPVTLYVPSAHVGGAENWEGGYRPARPILSWQALRDLARDGVDLGAHSRHHPHLSRLTGEALAGEIAGSKADLETQLNLACPHFAPPYGDTSSAVQKVISQYYQSSVTTEFARTRANTGALSLPRLEMLYFQKAALWRAYLVGQAEGYFHLRRVLRAVKRRVMG